MYAEGDREERNTKATTTANSQNDAGLVTDRDELGGHSLRKPGVNEDQSEAEKLNTPRESP